MVQAFSAAGFPGLSKGSVLSMLHGGKQEQAAGRGGYTPAQIESAFRYVAALESFDGLYNPVGYVWTVLRSGLDVSAAAQECDATVAFRTAQECDATVAFRAAQECDGRVALLSGADWQPVLSYLRGAVNRGGFTTWLQYTTLLDAQPELWRVSVPDDLTQQTLSDTYDIVIRTAILRTTGQTPQVEYVVTGRWGARDVERPTERSHAECGNETPQRVGTRRINKEVR